MDGQKEARKREPADAQMDKGEKRWTFEIINYASYHFIKIILNCKNKTKVSRYKLFGSFIRTDWLKKIDR